MFTDPDLLATMPRLKAFALRLTMNGTNAEDLLQSTLLRALEKRVQFVTDGADALFAWTSKIMFNLFATEYRRRSKRETQFDPELYLESAPFDAKMDEKIDAAMVLGRIRKMPHEHRDILQRVSLGQSYDEIAAALDIPLGTVRSRISRARDQILLRTLDPTHQPRKVGAQPGSKRRPRQRPARKFAVLRRAFAMAAFPASGTANGIINYLSEMQQTPPRKDLGTEGGKTI